MSRLGRGGFVGGVALAMVGGWWLSSAATVEPPQLGAQSPAAGASRVAPSVDLPPVEELAPVERTARAPAPAATAAPIDTASASKSTSSEHVSRGHRSAHVSNAHVGGGPNELLRTRRLARELIDAGRFREALLTLDRGMTLNPADGALRILRAEVNDALGFREAARADRLHGRELGVLEPVEGMVEGRVVDPQGLPVEGAALSVFRGSPFEGESLMSGPGGRFRFKALSLNGSLEVMAFAEGHAASDSVRTQLEPGAAPLLLTLKPESRVLVAVRDARTGAAVAGAQVSVGAFTQVTDAAGEVRIGRLHDGLHSVSVMAKGYVAWTRREVPATPLTQNRIEAALEPGTALSGTLHTPAGDPVVGARVSIGSLAAASDEDGRFSFVELPTGEHTVKAETPSTGASARVDLGTTTTLDLVLQPFAELRLSVVSGGEPQGVQVDVYRHGERERTLHPGSEGTHPPEELIPGEVELVVRFPIRARQTVQLGAGQTHELTWDLPGGGVRARLLQPDGAAASGAWVVLYREGERVGSGVADDAGWVEIKGLEAGVFDIYARHRPRKAVTFRHGVALPAALELTIPVGGALQAQLLDPSGAPLSDVPLTVHGVRHPVKRQATTDADGRFAVEELYPGRYRIEVDAAQLALHALRRGFDSLTVDATEFDALAGETGRLTLRAR